MKARRVALAALLPLAGLTTMAMTQPAQGKTLGAALTMWASSSEGYKVARWYRCSDGAQIYGVAAGYNSANAWQCETSSAGNTTTTTCNDTAIKHRAWWRAGSFNSTPNGYSSNWDEDRNSDFGSINAWEGGAGVCGSRGLRVADMGG